MFSGVRARWSGLAIAFATFAFASCGGGGGGTGDGVALPGGGSQPPTTQPPVAAAPPTTIAVSLQSDAGDTIGLGKSYAYSAANAKITVAVVGAHLSMAVDGDEHWTADFVAPASQAVLTAGTYSGLSNLPVVDPNAGAFRWFGEGRGCATSSSTVTIDQVGYSAGVLASFILRFERHCDGAAAALHGEVRWTSADTAQAPGRIDPAPAGLWTPPAGAVPATGNYVFLQSDAGDAVGLGKTQLTTSTESAIAVSGGLGGQVSVQVFGAEQWFGDFQTMDSLGRLATGYYPNLKGLPYYNPVRGGLAWVNEGRGCVALDGWFAIDRVVGPTNGFITGITLRFEQKCAGSNAVLHGALRWDAAPDRSALPPATLGAAGVWHAPTSALPPAGNYFYSESGDGDPIGNGRTIVATPLDAVIVLSSGNGQLTVSVAGTERFDGLFIGPAAPAALQPGVYEGLRGLNQIHPPPSGTMIWSVDTRGCADVRGWMAIDNVSYGAAGLSAIDLRFEQACDNAPATLKGQLHWRADDVRKPLGPVLPVPPELWRPAPGAMPASGNDVHIEGDRGDHVTLGLVADYTQTNSVLTVTSSGATAIIDVNGDERWNFNFNGIAGGLQLQSGYYPGLKSSLGDPAKGTVGFSGEGRGCNESLGWVAVDNVVYTDGLLTALDLRFETHCERASGATRGAVHWTNNDATAPPGPVFPPPASLWRPPAGATSASGTYVYLQSDPGDFIGNGQTWTSAAPASSITIGSEIDGALRVDVAGPVPGSGDFRVMSSRTRLERGYYGDLQEYPFHNPARGGLSWSSQGVGCNTVRGWFVVDDVDYDAGGLALLDLRFEQHCDGAAASLHGRIRWQR